VNGLDVSNSNTPGAFDPTNPVPGADFRAVAQVDARGRLQVTETNAYSGNNGRAAILNNSHGANVYYTAGNGGNGGNPQPAAIITGTGAQFVVPRATAGATTPLGSFNVTQLGLPADKVGKDTNFRGLTVFDNVVYYTKGSGGNGVNTVYFLDTTGHACPNGGAAAGGAAADHAAGLRPDHGAVEGPAEQHVRAGRLPDRREVDDVVPVRCLVRQPEHAVRGRRGQR
jgi:hypothetical protein